ncbi:MAG TPA: XRE family transcriptional regulator [Solirubrobacteraceae bacterium]|nr:XRE family transcriptional regulator [Solirubrobacteraceae bacterium]
MTHSDTGGSVKARLAANLRRLRVARHLSLSELARVTSTSKATLSGIENGRGNPTVETLALLAGALHVSIADLLEEARLGEVRILRASQEDPSDGIGRRRLDGTTELQGSLDIFELVLPARHVHEMSPRTAGSRQAVFVLHGKLIAGPVERISELVAGDYISFPADTPQIYETGRASARALVIASTPAC